MSLITKRFPASLEGVRYRRLALTTPKGHRHDCGRNGPEAEIRIADRARASALARRGDVGLGKNPIAGHWDSPDGEALPTLTNRSGDHLGAHGKQGLMAGLWFRLTDWLRANLLAGSACTTRAHCDVGNEFYQLCLDPGMRCFAALFDGTDDLEAAQAYRNARILSRLAPGKHILEIGRAWGGFAERAADTGRHVVGPALSRAQNGHADARLDGRAVIGLQNYRHAGGRYDNIAAVAMVEAMGDRYWPACFATLKARLAPGGRAGLQAITVPEVEFSTYRKRSDLIRQHILSGGMPPSPAVLAHQGAQAGPAMRDSFSFGRDCARTRRIRAARMAEAAPRIRRYGYDDAFLRGWRYYLEGCAATFATGRTDMVQVEYSRTAGVALAA